jgi:hypothetical protein
MPKNPKADLHYKAAYAAIVRAERHASQIRDVAIHAAIVVALQKAKNELTTLLKAV